jgi:tetratricopeptide (TPR) repeat protein
VTDCDISLVLHDWVFRHPSRVKLSLFILAFALTVSLLFRLIEWPWVAFRQAEAAVTHGNYSDAAELYERAAQKLDDLRVLEPLAKSWLALGRSREAEALLARILEKHPDQLPAIKLLSGLYQQSKQPDKAILLFVQYLALGKKLDPSSELQLARIYRQAARYNDAAPLYVRAAAEDPKQKSVGDAELAEMRSWQGQYDEAITLFREVLQTDPANRHARLELARALSWSRRYKESEDEYKKILKKP